MKTIIFFIIGALLLIVSTSDAKRLFYDNDNDMELSDKKARMFLRSMLNDDSDDDDAGSLDTRESGKKCVPCKFGINPCCAPNICIKKKFRPDECMEIKTGK
ncbi:unnamed protein product [Rotaria sordida]|uniref:Uncharacterized protein n=1 Tax=Rotaria sordida TaxID=392033 RepID=A0A814WN94_9BILA|nr:unnamed protein product [Rotaria sordida]CAF1204442.1 unnamed protein product [Rotaria sordida]CAF1204604.1 unnamed protein product [Rotaria sordida]CAF3727858.1 unnamed protein product [Rotaria sordida]CAF3729642.1 unnamed protein product [Rotaria sordida]